MKHESRNSRFGSFIMGTLFGATVSAIVALLFAPKSGKDFRKEISEETTKTLESTDEYMERAREKGTKVIHDVEDAALSYFNLAVDKAEDTVSETADTVEEKTEELEDAADEIETKVTEN